MPLGDHADRLSIRISQDRHYQLVRARLTCAYRSYKFKGGIRLS